MRRKQQKNMTLSNATLVRMADLADQRDESDTAVTENAIEQMWLAAFEFDFNRACTQLGITNDREPFAAYWASKRNGIDECHTLDVWLIIYRCFEDSRDAADERATQEDALR